MANYLAAVEWDKIPVQDPTQLSDVSCAQTLHTKEELDVSVGFHEVEETIGNSSVIQRGEYAEEEGKYEECNPQDALNVHCGIVIEGTCANIDDVRASDSGSVKDECSLTGSCSLETPIRDNLIQDIQLRKQPRSKLSDTIADRGDSVLKNNVTDSELDEACEEYIHALERNQDNEESSKTGTGNIEAELEALSKRIEFDRLLLSSMNQTFKDVSFGKTKLNNSASDSASKQVYSSKTVKSQKEGQEHKTNMKRFDDLQTKQDMCKLTDTLEGACEYLDKIHKVSDKYLKNSKDIDNKIDKILKELS